MNGPPVYLISIYPRGSPRGPAVRPGGGSVGRVCLLHSGRSSAWAQTYLYKLDAPRPAIQMALQHKEIGPDIYISN